MSFAGPRARVEGGVANRKHVVQFIIRDTCKSLNYNRLRRYKVDVSRVEANGAAGREILGFDDERVLLPPTHGVAKPRGNRRRRVCRLHPNGARIVDPFRYDY